MNNERMPINIYKLDAGYNDKGMNSNELIKDYKRNIQKAAWIRELCFQATNRSA